MTAGITPGAGSLDLLALTMGLLGGLALFLLGMDLMAEALKKVAGERMRWILAKLTTNRVTGALTGALVTAVIQSSSVTTVLVVGFITAGVMSISQAVGVIMGANIGTTITAQIIAFKVTKYALALIAVGFSLAFFSKREQLRLHGEGIMGLGLVFFGMAIMGEAMAPLRTYEPFLDWMARMESPALGILAAALFTGLVQSSSATTGIVIVMAGQGLITLSAGIALILGANIGTCVTALLAAIGKPRRALRASLVHVLFNVFGVLLWVGFTEELASFVTRMSPVSESLEGTARLAADTPRQIANAHTVFNVANTLIFLPLAAIFARLALWMAPDRVGAEAEEVRPRYLDPALVITPALALDHARLELVRVGERSREMLSRILPAVLSGSRSDLAAVAKMDDAVDTLHGNIVQYLGQIIGQNELTESQTEELVRLMEATNDLENIADIIETNLVALGNRRIEAGVTVYEQAGDLIREFHGQISLALDLALRAVTQKDRQAAERVVAMKPDINRIANTAIRLEAARIAADTSQKVEGYSVEVDIVENLKRVYYFCKRMARAALPDAMHKGVT